MKKMRRSAQKKIPDKVIHGGKKRFFEETTGSSLIDFSASLNPFPPSLPIQIDVTRSRSYPDDTYSSLKQVIGRIFHRNPDEICVGNGSIEVIRAFCAAVLRSTDRVVIHQPTFGEYAYSARLMGAKCTENPEGAAVQFICNPNNPTGELTSKKHLLELADQAEKDGTLLFVDEAFIELSDRTQSLAGDPHPAVVVARSLTKSFAIPGLRFGYGFGNPELIARIEAVRLPWTVNTVAEAYALEAFRQYDRLEESRQRIAQERAWLFQEIRNLGVQVERSETNFLLIHLPMDAHQFADQMVRHGILIRDCTSFGLPRSIRVAVMRREENHQLIEAMRACLP